MRRREPLPRIFFQPVNQLNPRQIVINLLIEGQRRQATGQVPGPQTQPVTMGGKPRFLAPGSANERVQTDNPVGSMPKMKLAVILSEFSGRF